MNSQEVKIVQVRLEDREKLVDIGYRTFYDAFGPPVNTEKNIQSYLQEKFTLEQITKELTNVNSIFFFAKLQDQIVGYIKLNSNNAQTESVKGNSIEIERIYVVKEFQGKNIGQVLFNKSLQVAREKNVDFIWLGVWDQNPGAIKFYERNGFKIFDKHPFVLGTEDQTDVMMKLRL
ncbi:GNAT family N-acetyltransferase [Aquimarina gracilis]|uniref:GNAT family N-acetyltransferase n=1 Tax=Aquimarina gracilis TaxID=874422 RepID=A0ABU5ZXZ5_9FLAO|nr:GNAT family N-acetyltransferase [Aquimarina gracilis]MEB3346727.1 GNAT family N-acetyltransferase [Aquimarina gracilis]